MKRSLERKVQKAIEAANEQLARRTGGGLEPRLVITAVAVQAVKRDGSGDVVGEPVTVVSDRALS